MGMVGWRWRPGFAAAVVAFFLIAQITIPVARLFTGSDGMQRFGWQMFSRASPATVFVVVTPDDEVPVSPRTVMARARGDLDLETLIPPFLCARNPSAERIVWDSGEHRC